MSDDGPALLRAILEAPADDAPRLVYADWLEENGQTERAEFIRTQIELVRRDWKCAGWRNHAACVQEPPAYCLEGCHDCDDHSKLWSRERQLRHDHEWDWLHAVNPELHRGSYAGERTHWLYPHDWTRGFISAITLPGPLFAEGGECGHCQGHPSRSCRTCAGTGRDPGVADSLLAAHPVQDVRLTTWPEVDVREDLRNLHFEFSLRGRDEIRFISRECLVRATPEMLGTTPDGRPAAIIRQLLNLEWPKVAFHLPDGSTC